MSVEEKERLTHIILADVDAFDAGSKGDINTIVDQKGDVVFFGDLVQLLRSLDQAGRIAGFVPQLNDGHTCTRVSAGVRLAQSMVIDVPPSTAALTTDTRSRPRRMAGVLSVTR